MMSRREKGWGILLIAAMVLSTLAAPLPAEAVWLEPMEVVEPFGGGSIYVTSFDNYGHTSSIDGNTLAVGAPGDLSVGDLPGSVYILTRSGGTWTRQAKLQKLVPTSDDRFGWSVAVAGDVLATVDGTGKGYIYERSGTAWNLEKVTGPVGYSSAATDGTRVVFGYPDADTAQGADAGSVAVYSKPVATWTEQLAFTSTDLGPSDSLGESVAIDGNYLIAGATGSQEAFVFKWNTTTWVQREILQASDTAAGSGFGKAVALDGTTAIVGAPFMDDDGAAYVFERSGAVWTEEGILTGGNYYHGNSVDVDGDTAVVGASRTTPASAAAAGALWVYTRSGTTWTQQNQFIAAAGTPHDRLGKSVGVDGDTLIGGAPEPYVSSVGVFGDNGQVYIRDRTGTSWSLTDTIFPDQQASSDNFGTALAADAGTLAASGDQGLGLDSVWTYERGSPYAPQQIIEDPHGTDVESDGFGDAIDLSGDRLIVGATGEDTEGANAGAAYLYERSGTDWGTGTRFTASDATAGDEYGNAVAIDDDKFAVGAEWAGTVYAYKWNGSTWVERKVKPDALPVGGDITTDIGFGQYVALDGSVMAVTFHGWYHKFDIYIFEWSGTAWTQTAYFHRDDSDSAGAIAVSGDTVIVGAPYEGEAIVYRKGTVWALEQVIDAPPGASQFGTSVDLMGDLAIVGAPGSKQAFVYERSGTTWTLDKTFTSGETGFGKSVAVDDTGFVVGAPASEKAISYARSQLCNGKPVTIEAMAGVETVGTSGKDVILGTPGDDLITGSGGNDTICGEGGADTIIGGFGNDTLFGGDGNDTLKGGPGVDRIYGEAGDDVALGHSGPDRMYGGPGADTLSGWGRDDMLYGGAGDDILRGGAGDDDIWGGNGADRVLGHGGVDEIWGEAGDDSINGGLGDDVIWGGDDDDRLQGTANDDTINGGLGNDVLNGGPGTDTLNGGLGQDRCTVETPPGVSCETLF
ncbi:hypothetical protein HQ535_11315 [bacterium]|nr:hypothetical protein [bacterium]